MTAWTRTPPPRRAERARRVVGDDEDLAYQITKAMFENIADLRAVHPAANETTVEFTMSATPVPLHPGAIRYYEEIGAEIPDNLRP
jgi:uncharacterized protein